MKQHNFVKYHPRINKITGCQRSTLILSTLEYWFNKKPDGFYKFIEPCSHRLYREGDSWTEELDCDRKSFAASFDKIAVRYKSRGAFNDAEDKFQNKMYASYYDRNTNQTYFIRNHDLANDVLSAIILTKGKESKKEADNTLKPSISLPSDPLRNGKNSRSYKEPKNTSNNLSKDKYHAGDIVKNMIEIWTAFVEQGGGQIQITAKRIAFLRQAFVDKFDCCLEKWKKYCQDIASSRFLMGEIKSSFSATLDWALKFDSIQKVFDGNYGIGDRSSSLETSAAESFLKNSKIELDSEEEEIQKSTNEPEPVKAFRVKWLKKFGASNYRETLKNCALEVTNDTTLNLRPNSRYNAKSIASYWTPTLLEDSPFVQIHIYQREGDLVFDKLFGKERGREVSNDIVESAPDLTASSIVLPLSETVDIAEADCVTEKSPEEAGSVEDETPTGEILVTQETQVLREKLREYLPRNQFPSWLEAIEVVGIGKDGVIVVTLEDSLVVGWCQSRFSGEILQAATSLWKGVNMLVIQEKQIDSIDFPVEEPLKLSEHVVQKQTLEQAIQSLLAVGSRYMSKTTETFEMYGAYQSFG